jgi:hypothetical protein
MEMKIIIKQTHVIIWFKDILKLLAKQINSRSNWSKEWSMEQLILSVPFTWYWKRKGEISKGCYSVLYSPSLSEGRLLSLSIEQILNTCVRSAESMLGHSQVSWYIYGPRYSVTAERICHAFLEWKLISLLTEDRTFKEEELFSRFYVLLNKYKCSHFIHCAHTNRLTFTFVSE